MKVQVSVNNVRIIEPSILNENEYNIHECEFEFTEEYNGLSKKAIFTNETNGTYVETIVNNKCPIPSEVLKEKEFIKLGVYAYDVENEELIVRYSPKPTEFYIQEGSYKNAGGTPPTPSEIEQLQAQITHNRNDIEEIQDNINDINEQQAIQDETIQNNTNAIGIINETIGTINENIGDLQEGQVEQNRNIQANADDIEDIQQEQTEQNTNIQKNKDDIVEINQNISAINTDIGDLEQDINAINQNIDDLEQDLTNYSLITETGSQINLNVNSTNYQITAILKDKNGNVIYTSNAIDLPIESMIINASYDNTTKEIVLTLQNGNTLRISIADLVSGLVSETQLQTILTNYYTKTEVDNLLSAKANQSSLDTTNQNLTNLTGRVSTNEEDIADIKEEQTTQNEDIEELQSQVETLQEDLDNAEAEISELNTDITNMRKAMITVDGQGTDITLENTSENKFVEFGLEGRTEQATSIVPEEYQQVEYISSSGSQYIDTEISDEGEWHLKVQGTRLLNATQIIVGKSSGAGWWFGITPTSYTDGKYGSGIDNVVNILGTEMAQCVVNTTNQYIDGTVNNEILPRRNTSTDYSSNTYYLFGLESGFSSNCKLYKAEFYKNGNLIAYFIPCYRKSDNVVGLYDTVRNRFFSGSGTFNKGDDITVPNSDFEIPIKNVTGNVNVKIQNKNLINYKTVEATYNTTVQLIENGFKATGSYAGKIVVENLKPNTNYCLNYDKKNITGSGKATIIYAGTTQSVQIASSSSTPFTFNTGENTTINIWFYTGNGEADFTNIQLEEGTTATDYVPHQEQNYPFTLGDKELCQIRTFKDYFFKNVINSKYYNNQLIANKWYLHKELAKYDLGNATWAPVNEQETARTQGLFCSFSKKDIFEYSATDIPAMLSNKYKARRSYELVSVGRNPADNTIATLNSALYIQNSLFSGYTNAQVKTALQGTLLYYPLGTPTNTEITDTTLIEQLDAILEASSYDDITIMSSESDELGFDMNVVAVADANKVIDNQNNEIDTIKSRLDLLEG